MYKLYRILHVPKEHRGKKRRKRIKKSTRRNFFQIKICRQKKYAWCQEKLIQKITVTHSGEIP